MALHLFWWRMHRREDREYLDRHVALLFGAEGGDRSVCVYAHIRMNTPHQQILTERGITCIRQKCLPGYRQQGQMPLN